MQGGWVARVAGTHGRADPQVWTDLLFDADRCAGTWIDGGDTCQPSVASDAITEGVCITDCP